MEEYQPISFIIKETIINKTLTVITKPPTVVAITDSTFNMTAVSLNTKNKMQQINFNIITNGKSSIDINNLLQ